MKCNKSDVSVDSFVRVEIPTTPEFLTKWHAWIHGKVSKHYKRDKERIPDTAQRVRLRLLTKDFISRWFFKHLTDDLVDLSEAISMTGNLKIHRSPKISPVYGDRNSEDSLWRISDLLELSNFDYERYFYSIQGHTIETDKFLRLMGYGYKENGKWIVRDEDYGVLESLYRQGRIKPSEFTDHDCISNNYQKSLDGTCTILGCEGKHFSKGFCKTHYRIARQDSCAECDRARASLYDKGISLAHRWTDPLVIKNVRKLRWDDTQLKPFLREWQKGNLIKKPPRYIMRLPKEATIDAGLLKYANMVVDNDVFNHFKSMLRTDDVAYVSLDVKSDPDSATFEKMYWESEDDGTGRTAVFIDSNALNAYEESDVQRDLYTLISKAELTDLEKNVLRQVDLEELSITDVAQKMGMPSSRVTKIRMKAIYKMRNFA